MKTLVILVVGIVIGVSCASFAELLVYNSHGFPITMRKSVAEPVISGVMELVCGTGWNVNIEAAEGSHFAKGVTATCL